MAERTGGVHGVDVVHAHRPFHEASAHLGVDEPGRDHVDVDAVAAFFFGQGGRQGFHRGLRHVVRRRVGRHVQRRRARDHHDVAARSGSHRGQDEFAQRPGAERMRAHDPFELGRVGVGDRPAARRVAGVVHEYVDVAEVGDRRTDHRLALCEVVDRGRVRTRPPTEPFDLRDRLSGRSLVLAVVDRDVGAVGRESERDRLTDPPAASRHQCDASFEHPRLLDPVHGRTLPIRR